jgi:hypothetical protein
MAQELAKAKIVVLDGRRAGEEVAVLFNPTDYSLETSNNYQKTTPPGLQTPITQFVNGEAQSLTMELYFDTYTDAGGDVSALTGQISGLLKIDDSLHAPPRVQFRWGVFTFKAVIERLSQRFTMFQSDGTPVRATLNVTFGQYRSLAEQLEDPRRNSADKTKRREMTADDSIWLLAHREYRDVRFWRQIARANRIERPLDLQPGDVLLVPPLTDDATRARR